MKKVVLVLSSPYILSDEEAAKLDQYIESYLGDSFVPHYANFRQASSLVASTRPDLVVVVGTRDQNAQIAFALNAIENEPDVDPEVEIDIQFVEDIRQLRRLPVLDCEQPPSPLRSMLGPELPEKYGLHNHPEGVMIDMFDRKDSSNKLN